MYLAEKQALDKALPGMLEHIEALEATLELEKSIEKAIEDATRKRNEEEAASLEADNARNELNRTAEEHYRKTLEQYNQTIALMELEASVTGGVVTEQERLNAAQKAYIDLIAQSNGTITAQGPSARAFENTVDLPGLEALAEQEANLEKITAILGEAQQAVEQYGLSLVDLNLIALENAGATMEQISAYISYTAELKRLQAETVTAIESTEEMTESLKEMAVSMAASGATDMFASLGEAMATNANVGDAALESVRNFAAECLRQVSSLAITAGLRQLASGNVSLGLALLAIGGITGLAGGALGAGKSSSEHNVAAIDPVDYKKYISDPIVDAEMDNSRRRIEILKEQLKEEKRLRDENIDKLEEEFNKEYTVLKDLWDRNIISTAEFQRRGDILRETKNSGIASIDESYTAMETNNEAQIEAEKFIAAQNSAITDLYARLSELESKEKGANGIDVFTGSGHMEKQIYQQVDIRKEEAKANYSIAAIKNAKSQEEMDEALRVLSGTLNANQDIEGVRKDKLLMLTGELEIYKNALANEKDDWNRWLLGVASELTQQRVNKATSAKTIQEIIAAREGADFTTSGPQMLLVGDNPTGRERVQVTPLGSRNLNGPRPGRNESEGQTVNIYITGEVYGVEDLYMKLNAAGKALARKGRI